MQYRLSLDLGVSSIGSAAIALNVQHEASEIMDAAVRIFPVSEGAEARREKRQARKNNERTKKRLQLLATALHEKGFWASETQETPKSKQNEHPYNISPYAIRAHAIHSKLNNPHELGRALLHMAKHRGAGFIEAMENIEEDEAPEDGEPKKKKKEKELSSYALLPKYMRESDAETVGEYFHMRLHKGYRNKSLLTGHVVRQRTTSLTNNKPVDYAIARYLIKDEFYRIWDKQAQYYPALHDEDFKQKIYDILFYERPSAPFATADCIYVDGEKRLLKAHPLAEKRRIYEATNNIRLATDGGRRKLTRKQRDIIISDILMQGKNANKTSIREALGFDRKTDVVFSDKETGIKPYLYSKEEFTQLPAFTNMTEEKLTTLVEFMAEPRNPNDALGRLYSEDATINILKGMLGIEDEIQIGELLAKLPKGRTMLGITATKKILELLENGIPGNEAPSQREAADHLVKSGDMRFKAAEVLAQESQGKYDSLPYYGKILRKDTQPIHPWQKKRNKSLNTDEMKYGKIANPAVHRMLNQLRRIVNDIIRIYGRPYEINIELGRDVGMSAKKKTQHETQQRLNEKTNEEAIEYLKDKKVKITRENILKYKLAKEQNWHDVFSPQRRIEPRFSGFEIEHLIPQAQGGSDSPANLVLVDRNENFGKGNRYPHEYFTHDKSPEQMREIIKNARAVLSENKKWRFESDAREKFEEGGDEDATDRYLTDTRYMAKLAARYLRAILDFQPSENDDTINSRILTVKGAHTAKLRTAWNLDGLEYELMGLDIPRYLDCSPYWMDQETGEIVEDAQEPEQDGTWKFYDKKRNPDWKRKPRIDHRHHALDAIALGCINRNFSSQLNWADKRGIELKSDAYPLPLAGMEKSNAKAERARFRQTVLELLKETKVSHKAEHTKQGELHEATGKAMLKLSDEHKDKTITRYNRKILAVLKQKSDLSKLLINSAIKSEWHEDIAADREKLEKLVADFEGHYEEAKAQLEARNETLMAEGKKERKLSEAMILAEAFKIIKEKGLWKGERFSTYTNEKSLIIIDKHKIAYKSGNNHRIDFYEKDGKVECEVINNFDANKKDFTPKIKEANCQPIWSLYQGDMIELDTPEEWKSLTGKARCIAEVRKFRHGRNQVGIILSNDARNGENKPKPEFMFPLILDDKGVGFFVKHNARKIELSPSGSVRKKHKRLWHGKKAAA